MAANTAPLPAPADLTLATTPDRPHDPGMESRLARLEGTMDGLKVVKPLTIGVVSLAAAMMIASIAFLGVQVARLDQKIDVNTQRLNDKLDALPVRLAEEFRAMRLEMAAQTSAIANAVIAVQTRPQRQPPQEPTPPR